MYREIIKEIKKNGGSAYIVGGYVRDMIMGTPSKDMDIEVFGIEPEKLETVLSKFGKWKTAGKEFQIYLIKGYELSYPRKNNLIAPHISVEEASRRRDLSINSLYYDPISGEVLDFNGGVDDIKKGIIRHVDAESFLEDPLRMLRVAQFKARFDFQVSEETTMLLKENFYMIKSVKGERIFIELEKILLKCEKPSIAFEFLQENGLLAYILEDLSRLSGIEQDKVYHPEGDVFVHTMMCLDVLEKYERNLSVMLAILFHDIGKGLVEPVEVLENGEKLVVFPGHSEASSERFSSLIKAYTNNKKLIQDASRYILYHEEPLKMLLEDRVNKVAVRKLAVKVDIQQLLKVYQADVLGRGREDNIQELETIKRISRLYDEIRHELEPIVKGRHLLYWGLEKKKEFSEVLEFMYEKQLEEKFSNLAEAQVYFRIAAKRQGWK